MRAIRKYGRDNFKIDIIEKCSKKDLNSREMYWIEKNKSFTEGYNQNPGGNSIDHLVKVDHKMLEQIIYRLKNTSDTHQVISEDFDLSRELIRSINVGKV